jgi:hypothetical protein
MSCIAAAVLSERHCLNSLPKSRARSATRCRYAKQSPQYRPLYAIKSPGLLSSLPLRFPLLLITAPIPASRQPPCLSALSWRRCVPQRRGHPHALPRKKDLLDVKYFYSEACAGTARRAALDPSGPAGSRAASPARTAPSSTGCPAAGAFLRSSLPRETPPGSWSVPRSTTSAALSFSPSCGLPRQHIHLRRVIDILTHAKEVTRLCANLIETSRTFEAVRTFQTRRRALQSWRRTRTRLRQVEQSYEDK